MFLTNVIFFANLIFLSCLLGATLLFCRHTLVEARGIDSEYASKTVSGNAELSVRVLPVTQKTSNRFPYLVLAVLAMMARTCYRIYWSARRLMLNERVLKILYRFLRVQAMQIDINLL